MNHLHYAVKITSMQRKIFGFVAIAFISASSPVHAAETQILVGSPTVAQTAETQNIIPDQDTTVDAPSGVPDAEEIKPVRIVNSAVTAYNSLPGQTDGSPFVTADGSCVGDGIVAANFLRIGTKVRLPDLFGDKIFEVRDRMNERYTYRIDVWMKEKKDAKQFGYKRKVKIEVLEDGDGKKNWDQKNTNAGCRAKVLGI